MVQKEQLLRSGLHRRWIAFILYIQENPNCTIENLVIRDGIPMTGNVKENLRFETLERVLATANS